VWDDERAESEPREGGPPQAEAALKSPPIVTPGAVLSLVVGIFILFALGQLPDVGAVPRAVMAGFIILLAAAPLYFSYKLHRSAGPRSLVLFSDRMLLPINARTTHRLSIRFAEVTGLLLHDEGRRGFLIIGTGRFDFFYPLSAFRHATDAHVFVEALKGQLRSVLPHGERKVDAFDAEGARSAEAMTRRPWALLSVAAGLVGAALILWGAGGFEMPFASVRFGALSRPLVLAGDWYRVASHVFVHASPLPLLRDQNIPSLVPVIHAVTLFVLGRPLERLLGPWFVLATFVAGTLVGAAFVVAANDAALIHGTGGAIFAFIGAMVFLAYQARERIPLGFRMSHRYWFWALLLGTIVLFSSDATFDLALGGLLAGVVTVAPFVTGPIPRRTIPAWVKAVAIGGPIFFVGGFAVALQRAPTVGVEDLRPVVERHRDPQRLNFYAWEVALAPEPSAEELDLAETAARRGLDYMAETVGAPAVKDTLATVLYRQRDYAGAVALQLEVLAENDDPVFASQLARFSWAALRAGAAQTSTTVRVSMRAELSSDGRLEVTPILRGELDQPLSVFGVIREDERLDGLVRLGVRPDASGRRQTLDTPRAIPWSATSTLTVTHIQPGRTTSKAWPMQDEVRAYP